MTTTNQDIEALDPELKTLTLSTGLKVEIQRLKLRQLLRALKILSAGASPALAQLANEDSNTEDFAQTLLVAMAVAIPEAENETVDFLVSMLLPVGFHKGRVVSRAKQEENDKLLQELDDSFYNPDLEDLLDVVEAIVETEAPHLKALGNRLATLLKAQQKSAVAKQKKSSTATSKASTKKGSPVE